MSTLTNKKYMAICLSLIVLCLSLMSANTQAGMVDTHSLTSQNLSKATLMAQLDTAEIQETLQAQGISADMAAERIASLTDAELAQFAEQIENGPAGGNFLGLLAVLFVLFVVTDAACATDLFTFVDCAQ